MVDRAVNYVRYHGDAPFSPGGSFYDIMYCMKNYGLVPQEAMPGIMYGDSLPVHNELDAVAGAYVKAIGKGNFSKLTPVWKNGISAIYDTYLGKCPEKFTYMGTEYTPKSFAASLGINPDDYVSLTSYTHHPFYTQFAIEIQDNWRNGLSYNLPIDELMAVMDNAIRTGYTFAWGSDVSEQGFTRDGIAVMPDAARGAELTGSDMARWTGMTATDKRKELTSRPLPEVEVTQEMRQVAFDNWETTDDPEVATITGSTTTFVAFHALRRSAMTSIISTEETMPILTALGRMSSKTASICAATISGEISCTAVTPRVFCAVMAVMAVSAYRRCAVMVLMSA